MMAGRRVMAVMIATTTVLLQVRWIRGRSWSSGGGRCRWCRAVATVVGLWRIIVGRGGWTIGIGPRLPVARAERVDELIRAHLLAVVRVRGAKVILSNIPRNF